MWANSLIPQSVAVLWQQIGLSERTSRRGRQGEAAGRMVHLGYWMYGGIDGVCACVPIFSRGAATDGHALADSTASGHRADSYVSPHASSRVSAAIVHVPPNAGAVANHTGYATPTAQHSTLHVPAHTVAHYCHSDTNQVPDGFTHLLPRSPLSATLTSTPLRSTLHALRSADSCLRSARLRDDRHADDLRLPAGA